jgi:1-aminocyclopropane-1-carboxylate deaminase/D-cysteine desulfhydrase-like pyridoxal-dependent ACC family enzyme
VLDRVPRVSVACLPTPLHEAPRLAASLGGPRIFVKRDDLTGLAFGGNKTRNLEFRLAHAMKDDPDVVLVGLDLQSNSARQTVGACNKLGLRTILVLVGTVPRVPQGNVLVDQLLGAEIHFVCDQPEQESKMAELMERERSQGHRPHNLNENPMFDIASAIAYIESMMECIEQMSTLGVSPDYVYMSSSGKGQAGLVLFQKLFAADLKVHGITATSEFNVSQRTAEIANRTARHLGLDVQIDDEMIVNFDDFVGPAYGIPSEQGNEAVGLVARTEGLILDPVYTGKCAAGMIHHIRSGLVPKDAVVLFIHTGGTPAIFTYSELWS